MSATVVYKTVHGATGPLVFFFPKMAPAALLNEYLKQLQPGMKYYCASGTQLTRLSKCKHPWVLATLVAVKTGNERVHVPSMEHVITFAERDRAKEQYEAFVKAHAKGEYLRSLENAEDNVSIVAVKHTTLQFSNELEHVREFEKKWSVKSISNTEHMTRTQRRQAVADLARDYPATGALRTGCKSVTMTYSGKDHHVLAVFKTAKLFQRVVDRGLLLPFVDVRPGAYAVLIAPLSETVTMAKDLPRNAKTLFLVDELLDRMYTARIVLTSGEAVSYIAVDKGRGHLYFQLPACMAAAPVSMSKKQHRESMLDLIASAK
jgi:hypothetical protein